jgi:4-hydroxy-2-oxoheptanedioate aldolase
VPDHGGNPLRALWRAGEQSVGTWCSLAEPTVVEIVAQSGFDWVIVDWQHGQFGAGDLATMINVAASAGATPLVRVPLNEPWMLQKALDMGAYGVVVPLVNTVGDARRAAAATRYPPHGVRSFGPVRASAAIGWEPDRVNAEVVCIVQIETREALENVEALAATPGVDALFVGPADLAVSLGLGLGAPELDDLLGPVFAAAARHRLPVGRHCNTAGEARTALAGGFAFVAVGGDTEFLADACVAAAAAARTQPPVARAPLAENLCRVLVSSTPPAP